MVNMTVEQFHDLFYLALSKGIAYPQMKILLAIGDQLDQAQFMGQFKFVLTPEGVFKFHMPEVN